MTLIGYSSRNSKRIVPLLIIFLSLTLSSCLRNREAFYFGDYSQAEVLFSRGEYEQAIQKYQAYIDENPEGNLAIISTYYIGRSHEALGHKEEAVRIYKQIIENHSKVVWANFSETHLKDLQNTTPS